MDASEADLCYLFGLGSGPQTIPNVAEVNPSEVTHIVETYRRFQHDLKRLHWFIRVNTEAVTRILAKLVRNGEGKESSLSSCQARFNELQPTLEGQVMSRIARIGGLVDNANNSLARSKGAAGKSIYLIRAIRQNHCPRLVTEVVLEALQAGDVDQVLQLIISANADSYASEPNFLPLVHDLLKFSTLFRPSRLTALFALLPLSERCIIEPEVFTWSIIGLGQTQKLGNVETELQAVFESFNIETRESSEILLTKDSSGRLPLHYAAMYRLDLVCEQILQALRSRPGEVERALLSTDNEGMTPLHLAVSSNCKSTAKLMIAALLLCTGSKEKLKVSTVMGDVFNFALQHQNNKIISDSHFSSADLSIQSSRGETILHTAAQLGQADCVSLILNIMHSRGTGFDMPNTSQGWTPLFMASVHGHYDIVRLLLQAGSNQHVKDHRGWTAKEYAVFKGHLAVASLFKASHNGNVTGGPASSVPARRASHPIANIGQGEKVIIASLGTNRIDRVVTELDLAYCSSKHTPDTYDSLPFVLEVSAPGSTCGPRRVRLPILDDRVNDPFVFPIAETVSPQLVFKVFHLTGKPGEEVLVGSGAALLDSNTRQFGTQRQSLVHDQSVPILDAKTMSVSGTITFISFIAKSFPHLQDPQSIDYLARDFPTAPVLVGHRGLGQNVKSHDHLQLGENTIESFLAAATLGASFVEFDVQLTRDFKTVAFHDFSLSESGTDVAIHDLTLDQFLHASNIQSPHGDSLPVPGEAQSNGIPSRPRSRSLDTKFEAGADQTRDRMKHTVDFQQKGFKPNTRGDSIQGSFATLEEILAKLPQDIGCDIEISSCSTQERNTERKDRQLTNEQSILVSTKLSTPESHQSPSSSMLLSTLLSRCFTATLVSGESSSRHLRPRYASSSR